MPGLIVNRNAGESIHLYLGERHLAEITVLSVGHRARLQIEAEKDVQIVRDELLVDDTPTPPEPE